MQNTSVLGTFGKRAVAWIVIVGAAILALKLIVGAVLGFVTMLLTIALVVAAVAAVIWALRRL
ncbi:MAG: hypothetical protein ACR2L8_00190 [Solirubrobacteraceae bacterium]